MMLILHSKVIYFEDGGIYDTSQLFSLWVKLLKVDVPEMKS